MRRWGALLLVLAGCAGCADEEIIQTRMPSAHVAVADSYPVYEQQEEVTRPAPRLTHSLSLGFVGDEPLSNSVMRDTPMAPPYLGEGQTWQQYIRNPAWGRSYQPQPRYACDGYRCYALQPR